MNMRKTKTGLFALVIAASLAATAGASQLESFKASLKTGTSAKAPRAAAARRAPATLVARDDITHYMATLEDLVDATNALDTVIIGRGYLTSADLADYATTASVTSATNALRGYVDGQVSGVASAALASIQGATNAVMAVVNTKADASALADYVTNTSLETTLADYATTEALGELAGAFADDLADATNAVMGVVNGKADAATTLAGYGITDAKIDNGTITLGSATITPLTEHQSLAAYATTATVNAYSNELAGAISALDSAKADAATTLAGYGITDAKIEGGVITLGAATITPLTEHQSLAAYSTTTEMNTAIAGATNAVMGVVSGKADAATTLAGYGITDAKIENGTITLGAATITPLTSFTETDPTIAEWAKAETKPAYTFAEIGSTPTTLAGYGITDAEVTGDLVITGADSRKWKLGVDAEGTLFIQLVTE